MSRGFVGFGTGRCGTQSLARIIDSCKDTYVVHEQFLVNWYNPNPYTIENLIGFLISGPDDELRGAVSLSHIRIAEYLDTRIKNLKFVHIWRNKEEVADSFNRTHGYISRIDPKSYLKAVSNSLIHIKANNFNSLAGHPDLFPKIESEDSYDSYLKYWDHYMELVNNLKVKNLYTLNINDLNNNNELNKLCDYLEIPNKDRAFPKQRRYNAI